MRRPLRLWHRWFGLLGGAWLLIIALTGSVLVFHEELDHALNPDWFTASRGPSRSADELVAAAVAARPGFAARYVDLPDGPNEVATIWLTRRADAPTGERAPLWEVMVDPATAIALGARDRNAIDLGRRGIMAFLYTFHYSLHGGEWVRWLIGLLALAWLLDHAAAAVLALPSPRHWRQALRIRRGVAGHKRIFDLHRAVGLWLLPITATIAFSGMSFNLNQPFRTALSLVSPATPRPDETARALPALLEAAPVSFSHAVAAVSPARVDGLAYDAAKGLYWLRVFDVRDISPAGGRWVYVDARTGRIVADRHATAGTAGDTIMAWQFPLHSGRAFGWAGRLLVCAAGMMVAGFVVTGFLIWQRRMHAARLGRARRTPSARSGRPMPAPAE